MTPRFSLRFALIALTVFLIAFGFIVLRYQRYEAHEEIAGKLQEFGYEVEEETQRFAGKLYGKTLTGLITPHNQNYSVLELLGKIPRPGDLQRLAISELTSMNQENFERVLGYLEQFTNLQELHLTDVVFTKPQFERLSRLRALRHLNLARCSLPPDSLAVLKQMPELEILDLQHTKFQLSEFLKLNLPRLRILDLTGHKIESLELTAARWGRFPCLETLMVPDAAVKNVVCEPGAMRSLKHLDLSTPDIACKMDWQQLPETAPRLTSLALHTSLISDEVVPVFRRMKELRYVTLLLEQLNGMPFENKVTTLLHEPEFLRDPFAAVVSGNVDKLVVPVALEKAISELVKQCPQLVFCKNHGDYQELIAPRCGNNARPWESTNWRPDPGYGGGGFSGGSVGGGGFF